MNYYSDDGVEGARGSEQPRSYRSLSVGIVISAALLSGAWIYTENLKSGVNTGGSTEQEKQAASATEHSAARPGILPGDGVELPVTWGDLGAKLVSAGVIDAARFRAIYEERGKPTAEQERLLLSRSEDRIKITGENSGYLLNLFWALGLANKNAILEAEIENPAYGGAQNFASTAGWTVAEGSPMDHYNRHKFFNLTDEQQALVEKMSRAIYRPCCNNSTHFPDCNHGMAMLGLLELMASQGVSEDEMWQAALDANAYWFPDTYSTIAAYMQTAGADWREADPKILLGATYSSASGYLSIASLVSVPGGEGGGSGCGVDTGTPAQEEDGGCGI